eukprot:scaffold100012_cov42-Phaeocystis_antarctica.AAC.1
MAACGAEGACHGRLQRLGRGPSAPSLASLPSSCTAPTGTSMGPDGHVYGFEPTDAANLSRAVAAANRLSNVHVARSCLSNVSAPLRFCLRRLTAQGRLKG